jgi:hypothetical protein
MIKSPLSLSLEAQTLTVCRLSAADPVPAWAMASTGFLSITRTADELSIVCSPLLVPAGVKQEPGWRPFKIVGPLDFGLTGVLASILDPLAAARISIFSISTFSTDYVLVKHARVEEAVQVLRADGHSVLLQPA